MLSYSVASGGGGGGGEGGGAFGGAFGEAFGEALGLAFGEALGLGLGEVAGCAIACCAMHASSTNAQATARIVTLLRCPMLLSAETVTDQEAWQLGSPRQKRFNPQPSEGCQGQKLVRIEFAVCRCTATFTDKVIKRRMAAPVRVQEEPTASACHASSDHMWTLYRFVRKPQPCSCAMPSACE
jgi:hypothetical protein